MINTVADLLNSFKNREIELLRQYNIIGHPGLIGDMYEGLTKAILGRSLFQGLDLHVSGGKIRNSKSKYSDEIDCMLTIGEGEQIPYTDKFIYPSEKVIAIIQVKKNLYSRELIDSHKNLLSVTRVIELRELEKYHGRILRDTYRLICRQELPLRTELRNLPIERQMIYHSLMMEAFLPLRIVWGYDGFKTELSLRESFKDYLGENVATDKNKVVRGFSPVNLPHLIMCNKYSLIEMNGMPFVYPIDHNGWWTLYGSSHENPLYFFLELIWTRLSFMFGISPSIFGEDLREDEINAFLRCRFKQMDERRGWEYTYINAPEEILNRPLEPKDWEPIFLDDTQFTIMNMLCSDGKIEFENDEDFAAYVSKGGYTVQSFIDSLRNTGLVDVGNGRLSLITDECVCGVTQEGKLFAAENSSGRLERWLSKQSAEWHSPKGPDCA